jgi:hypothetical protein
MSFRSNPRFTAEFPVSPQHFPVLRGTGIRSLGFKALRKKDILIYKVFTVALALPLSGTLCLSTRTECHGSLCLDPGLFDDRPPFLGAALP